MPRSHQRPTHVLIVDTDASVRDLLRTAFVAAGCRITADTGNLDDALAKASTAQPDLVILDDARDAEDTLRAVRDLRRAAPSAEVVLYATRGGHLAVADALEAGVWAYMDRTARGPGEMVRKVVDLNDRFIDLTDDQT